MLFLFLIMDFMFYNIEIKYISVSDKYVRWKIFFNLDDNVSYYNCNKYLVYGVCCSLMWMK